MVTRLCRKIAVFAFPEIFVHNIDRQLDVFRGQKIQKCSRILPQTNGYFFKRKKHAKKAEKTLKA